MFKNLGMRTLAMSFETPADGGGGGTAVATPAPAAATPAPAAAAPAPAAKPKGMFDRVMPASLKRLPGGSEDPNRAKTPPVAAKPDATKSGDPAQTFNVLDDDGKTVLGNFKTQKEAEDFMAARAADPNAQPPAAAVDGQTFNVLADDGKTVLGNFKTEAEAQAFMDAQAGGAPAITNETKLPVKIFGRFETIKAVEEYMAQSGQHAKALDAEVKTLKDANAKILADREAEVAALKAEMELIRKTPAIKDLSKEELTALAKEDPAAAAEYIADKKFRERDAAEAKKQAEAKVRGRQEYLKKVNQAIEDHRAVMQKDAENFPQFEDFASNIGEIIKMTEDSRGATPLRGHVWAEELAYLAAYGKAAILAARNGKTVLAEAKKTNLRIAAAGAASTAGPSGGSAGRGSGGQQPSTKETKGSRIVKAAPRNRFFGSGKPQT